MRYAFDEEVTSTMAHSSASASDLRLSLNSSRDHTHRFDDVFQMRSTPATTTPNSIKENALKFAN